MTRSNLDCREDQVDTWDSLPSAATNSGRVISVTGIAAYPIKFVSNGTEWVPEGGQATLALSGIGYGIMPSGTLSAGSSGHFVSGTALPNTYSEGLWMYFAANAIVTPNISAGFYWCVFSNTTTCTIYSSGPGSAAINFSVGGAVTGYFGAEVTARSVTIPAGLMGENGQLSSDILTVISGAATTKIVRLKLGASTTTSFATAVATNLSIMGTATTTNASAAAQYSRPTYTGSTSTSTSTRTTIDTTASTTYALTLQMSAATDFVVNHNFRLDLFKV